MSETFSGLKFIVILLLLLLHDLYSAISMIESEALKHLIHLILRAGCTIAVQQ